MKRWQTGILAGSILIATTALAWFAGFFNSQSKASYAIPEDPIAVYKGVHPLETYQQFLKTNTGKTFKPISDFKEFNHTLLMIDSFIKGDSSFFRPEREHPYYLSLHSTGIDNLGLLFCWQTTFSQPLPVIERKLKAAFPKLQSRQRQFRSNRVLDFTYHDSFGFTMSSAKGIILISGQGVLVEDGIRKVLGGKDDQRFNQALKKHHKRDHLFLNFQNWPRFLGRFTNYNTFQKLQELKGPPGYAKYSFNFRKDGMQLSGPFHYLDTPSIGDKCKPQQRHFASVAPMQTAFLKSFALPEEQVILKNALKVGDTSSSSPTRYDSLENWYEFDLKRDFLPLIGHQVSLGINEPIGREFRRHTFAVIHYKDTAQSFPALRKFAANQGSHPKTVTTLQDMTYRDHPIRQLPMGNAFQLTFGPLFQYLKNPYYTLLEDCAVLAEAPVTLKRIIDDYEAGQTLQNAPHYENLNNYLLPKSQHFTFIHPNRASDIPLSFLKEELKGPYKKQLQYYSQFSGLAFQLQADSSGMYSQITLMERTTTGSATEKLWEQSLDTTLSQAPEVVIQPETKTPELILTDKQDHLYRMSNDGAIQWKKALVNPKMGSVDTIDLYQNGNQQYLFATRGKLHLLDEDGKEVGGFPLSLSAPAATEAVALGYEGQGKYRYFIGCQNNRIYGYRSGGNPLPGWRPVQLDAPLAFPLKYFLYGGKLRIFGVTEKGTLSLWNTQGILKERYSFETAFTHNFSMHFGAYDSTTYLVSTDTAGKTYMLYLNGDTLTQKFGDFSKAHHFLLSDLNGDGAESMIFAEGRKIQGYLPDGVQQFTLTLRDSIAFKPRIYRLQGRPYIGYVSSEDNRIFLIDQDGKPYSGFPLKGNTPFQIADMNRDGAKELIVGGKSGNVIMYKIE